MNNKNILSVFFRFLKNNGVYQQYLLHLSNHHKYGEYNSHRYLKRMTEDEKMWSRIIINAFEWADTFEGERRWRNLHDSWNLIIKEYWITKNFNLDITLLNPILQF